MRKVTKRIVAALLGVAGLAASVVPAAMAQDSKQLVIVTAGGKPDEIQRKYFFDPFEKETGIKIVTVGSAVAERNAKFLAMNKTGNVEWDLMFMDELTTLIFKDYLADPGPNCSKIPNAATLGVEGACTGIGVISTLSCICLAYPTGSGEKAIKNWAEFFDLKGFPGPRSMPDVGAPWYDMVLALVADGVSPDKLFPLDVDRALKKLDSIKSEVAVWWKTGSQTEQMIRSGEVKYAAMWDTRVGPLRQSGVPIDLSWYQAIPQRQVWVVPSKSKNQEAAFKFINFYLTRPEAHQAFSQELQLATSNKAALALMSDDLKKKSFANPENAASLINIDHDWVLAHREELLSRWQSWIAQ